MSRVMKTLLPLMKPFRRMGVREAVICSMSCPISPCVRGAAVELVDTLVVLVEDVGPVVPHVLLGGVMQNASCPAVGLEALHDYVLEGGVRI